MPDERPLAFDAFSMDERDFRSAGRSTQEELCRQTSVLLLQREMSRAAAAHAAGVRRQTGPHSTATSCRTGPDGVLDSRRVVADSISAGCEPNAPSVIAQVQFAARMVGVPETATAAVAPTRRKHTAGCGHASSFQASPISDRGRAAAELRSDSHPHC